MRSSFFAKLLLGVLPLIGLASGCTPYQGSATAYLTWHVVDAREPDPLTAPSLECALKNVQYVRVQLANSTLFDFPCNTYSGETTSFTSGTYTVDVLALSPTGAAQAAQRISVDMFGRTNLGHFIFQVR